MNHTTHIDLFGGLRVRFDGQTITHFRTQKTGGLLAFLAHYIARSHAREELIELFWPESVVESGRMSLRTALSALRRMLEEPRGADGSILSADRLYVALNAEAVSTDTRQFEDALAKANRSTDLCVRTELLKHAAELYRGPFLPGFYDDWAISERERLEHVYLGTIKTLTTVLEESGDLEGAVEYARRTLGLDRLDEASHCELIRMLAASGRPQEALRQFRQMERILTDELNVSPSPESRELFERIRSAPLRASKPAYRAAASIQAPAGIPSSVQTAAPVATPAPRLPLQLTRFFGREKELAEIGELLTSQKPGGRLVTITGPGGCGKTRVAIESAAKVSQQFEGAVWYVELAEIGDARLILSAIGAAIRIPARDELNIVESIANALGGALALLVLDNYEQLVENGVQVVRDLLERIPTVRFLITSRRRLDLGGEREIALVPLPIPSEQDTPERLLEFASVQLLMDRARAIRPDLQLSRANADSVSSICLQLEGLPLAIELAAAWASTLTLEQIAIRLKQGIDLLESRRRDLPARHRTLRATAEWSYRLLSPELRRLHSHLAVFHGGWTIDAAEAVCAPLGELRLDDGRWTMDDGTQVSSTSGADRSSIVHRPSSHEDTRPSLVDQLRELCDRSLVVAEERGTEMRFRILETLRAIALEQAHVDELNVLRQRHSDWFLRLAASASEHFHGPRATEWLYRLDNEIDNIRAALDWCRSDPSRVYSGLRMAYLLRDYWNVRGHLKEGYRRLTDLMSAATETPGAAADVADEARAEGHRAAGELAMVMGDLLSAREHLEESLAIWKRLQFMHGIGDSLCMMGLTSEYMGDYVEAHSLYEQSMGIWRHSGDTGGMAHAYKCLGACAMARGDATESQEMFDAGLSIYREIENDRGIVMMLAEMFRLSMMIGDFDRAERLHREHFKIALELRDAWHLAEAHLDAGRLAEINDDFDRAYSMYDESVAIRRELGRKIDLAISLAHLGHALLKSHERDPASACFEECLAALRTVRETRVVAACLLLIADYALISPPEGCRRAGQAVRLIAAAEALRQTAGSPIWGVERSELDLKTEALRQTMGTDKFEFEREQGRNLSAGDAIAQALDYVG